MRRLLILATSSLALTGCLDFLAPDLPEPGPAAFSASLNLNDAGTLSVSARLDPGLGEDLDWRRVPMDTVFVEGRALAPTAVQTNGSRTYGARIEEATSPESTTVIMLRAPPVPGIVAPPLELRWTPVRRAGPDTVALQPDGDLLLRIDTAGARLEPAPSLRQWFLGLVGPGGRTFQIGGSGRPPTDIDVPARWIPADSAGAVVATLVITESGIGRPAPGDYIAAVSVSRRIGWVVVRADSARTAGGGAGLGGG